MAETGFLLNLHSANIIYRYSTVLRDRENIKTNEMQTPTSRTLEFKEHRRD